MRLVTIVLTTDGSRSVRSHWPIHGPQALASTVPPIASRSASSPSRSIVARTCSDPGVMYNGTFAVRPCAAAWRAMDAARVMSSYDEFVHDPINAADSFTGTLFCLAHAPTSDTRWARSGVSGPLINGCSVDRSISITRSKNCSGSRSTSGSARRSSVIRSAASAISSRRVAFRYAAIFSSTGNIDVVAPSSAPMFVIVALPVALIVRAPGPMYSTIALVPPETVSLPAT